MSRFFLFIIAGLFTFTLHAQSKEQVKKKFATIKPGMSENSVIKEVGEPKKIEAFTTVRNNSYDTSTYWKYDKDVTVVFTNHAVESVEYDRNILLKRIQEKASRKDSEGLKIVNRGS